MELRLWCAGAADGRGLGQDGDDPHRAPFGNAGDQSPDGALWYAQRANSLCREAFHDGKDRNVEFAERSAGPVEAVCDGRSCWVEKPTIARTKRTSLLARSFPIRIPIR